MRGVISVCFECRREATKSKSVVRPASQLTVIPAKAGIQILNVAASGSNRF